MENGNISCGIVVTVIAFHAGGQGSIPHVGETSTFFK